MAAGYIPAADGAFDAWQANFRAYIDAHYGELGLPSDVTTRVKVAQRAGPSSAPVQGASTLRRPHRRPAGQGGPAGRL